KFNFEAANETGPVLGEKNVYVGGCSNVCTLYALDVDSGSLLWKTSVGTFGGILNQPIEHDGLVYFGTYPFGRRYDTNSYLYAVEATTGREVWSLKVDGGVSTYRVADEVLYFGNREEETGTVPTA